MSEGLVEGWTKPLDFALFDDGTALDGTDLTVTLDLRDRTGALVPTTGLVDWLSQSDGTVRYSPAAGDFQAARSPYAARFRVTDVDGLDAFYPNGEADVWIVRK